MSKTMKTVLLVICVVVFAAAVLLALRDVFAFTGYSYENADRYTAGGAEISGTVRSLDIDWVSGKIRFAGGSGNTVSLSETSDRPISGDFQLRWFLDGDTLRVRFAKNGFRTAGWDQQKELTVSLPEGIELKNVSVSATSADLSIPSLKAENVDLTTTSGDITAAAGAVSFAAVSTSGDMDLNVSGAVRELRTTSTSGSVRVSAEEAVSLKAVTTSGGIGVSAGRVEQLSLTSTSGALAAELDRLGSGKMTSTSGSITVTASALDSLEAGATSGGVSAFLPAEPGFTASVKTTSGRFDYSLPLTRNGSDYVCGDGSGRVSIHSTSGNVRIDGIQ